MASKKTSKKKTAKKKTAKKKTAKKKTAKKKTTKKKTAKKKTAKKKTAKKKTAKKKTAKKKTTKKKTTKRGQSPPLSVANADECRTLEECRGFIRELTAGAKQMNDWLNELHDAALEAEQMRDLYAGQIEDLTQAIDQDQAKIAQLESELRKARRGKAKTCASEAVVAKLDELSREIKAIRSDLKRLEAGRPMTTARRSKARRANGRDKTPPHSVGRLAKHSVLAGAACSLAGGRYGYPPEVCAPGDLPIAEAARILGQVGQHNYTGLAQWARIKDLPTTEAAASRQRAGKKTSKKAASSAKKAPTKKKASKAAPRTRQAEARSNGQILDEVLLTIRRL